MRLHDVVKRWSNFSCSSGPTNGSPHSAAKSRSFSKALAFAGELAYGQTLLNLPVASGIRVKGIKDLKQLREFVLSALLAGVLVVLPIYLATLLLLKAMKSLAGFVRPFTRLLPERFPAEQVLSFLLAVIFCFLVGIAVRTPIGHAARDKIENSLFQEIPGYTLFRTMTSQLAGESRESTWKPALAEIEDALVPAFIIERLDDGPFTVYIPSVPTPLVGAVYILTAQRVHPVNVPFMQAVKGGHSLGIKVEGPGGRNVGRESAVNRNRVNALISSASDHGPSQM